MSNNAGTIASFLHSKGLPDVAIAGVLGNLEVESGLSPKAYNPREKAIGLAQWELGRRTNLQKFAANRGGKETDLNIQLGFLWAELTGGYSGALAHLKTASTPAQAATIWDAEFEHSAGTSRGDRIAAAQKFAVNMPKTTTQWWNDPNGVFQLPGVRDPHAAVVKDPTSGTGALGLPSVPSADDIGAKAQKVGVYLIAFALGGGLLVLGLNKAAGNPAGKIASHLPIP